MVARIVRMQRMFQTDFGKNYAYTKFAVIIRGRFDGKQYCVRKKKSKDKESRAGVE